MGQGITAMQLDDITRRSCLPRRCPRCTLSGSADVRKSDILGACPFGTDVVLSPPASTRSCPVAASHEAEERVPCATLPGNMTRSILSRHGLVDDEGDGAHGRNFIISALWLSALMGRLLVSRHARHIVPPPHSDASARSWGSSARKAWSRANRPSGAAWAYGAPRTSPCIHSSCVTEG